MPQIGQHHYSHKLYALDAMLPGKAMTKAEIETAMKGHVLASAERIGT